MASIFATLKYEQCNPKVRTVQRHHMLAQTVMWLLVLVCVQVVGLINVQVAIQDGQPYIIEANPRASRYEVTLRPGMLPALPSSVTLPSGPALILCALSPA